MTSRSDDVRSSPPVAPSSQTLPSTPLRVAFASADSFHAVPIITGTNRDGMKLFFSGDNDLTKKRLGALLAGSLQVRSILVWFPSLNVRQPMLR